MNHFNSLDSKNRAYSYLAKREAYTSRTLAELGLYDTVKNTVFDTCDDEPKAFISIYGRANNYIGSEETKEQFERRQCRLNRKDRLAAEAEFNRVYGDEVDMFTGDLQVLAY